MRGLTRTLLLLTPMGVAALLRGGGTFGSFEELSAWSAAAARSAPPVSAPAARRRRQEHGIVRTKKVLLAVMAIGAAAYLGTGGTFSSFSAEVQNSGSSIASGTLTMNNQVNGGTLCLSAGGVTQNNINANCDAVVGLTNVAPGVFGGNLATAKVTITNTGSIDASKLYLYAPYTNTKLTSALTTGGPITTLNVSPLEGSIANLEPVVVSYGLSNTQTFTANGATPGGSTTITVGSLTPNFAYPIGSTVIDTSSDTTPSNTNCWDVKTGPGGGSPTKGADLNFNPITGNPFCSTVVMYVQETTANKYFCWYGRGKGLSPQASGGFCSTPVAVTLSSAATGTLTSISVTALNGVVKSGEQITVTSGANSQTCTASATARFLATTINITSCAFGATVYPIGSTVVNTTSLNNLNSETINTVSNFDTGNSLTGKITLAPVTADGTSDGTATVQLAASASRTFQVGLFLPAPSGSNQNALQGLASTFGMTWHMDQ